ncbi:hypothetical protein C8R31_101492 [Nitrosospira sp. Nsp2]|nr:hypothetical protein C8R31_101492 [Nitrosospira sp. Nsp2]
MLFEKTLNIAAKRAAQFPGNWKIEERSETVRNDEPKKREEMHVDTFVPFPSLRVVYVKPGINYSYLKSFSISPLARDNGLPGMGCAKGGDANGRAMIDADPGARQSRLSTATSLRVATNHAPSALRVERVCAADQELKPRPALALCSLRICRERAPRRTC